MIYACIHKSRTTRIQAVSSFSKRLYKKYYSIVELVLFVDIFFLTFLQGINTSACAQDGEIALGLKTHTKALIWRPAGDARGELGDWCTRVGKAFPLASLAERLTEMLSPSKRKTQKNATKETNNI